MRGVVGDVLLIVFVVYQIASLLSLQLSVSSFSFLRSFFYSCFWCGFGFGFGFSFDFDFGFDFDFLGLFNCMN